MGLLLHGSARTTAVVRRAIQHSQESLAKLAARSGLNPTTIAKRKKRPYVHDAPMGPQQPHSTVLTKEEEALSVTFRRHTLLPLDDGLYALQSTMPHLTRSALHRCLRRHGISRLPAIDHRFTALREGLIILTQAAIATNPGDRAFHHLAAWRHRKGRHGRRLDIAGDQPQRRGRPTISRTQPHSSATQVRS
jgi:hypothetical protein